MVLRSPNALNPPIAQIVERIVTHVRPRRVVLFGSHACGEVGSDSDLDLMVEVDDERVPRVRDVDIHGLFADRDWAMDVLVYTAGQVEQGCDDPGTMVYGIARRGRVLYQRADLGDAPMRDPRRVWERPPTPPSVQHWLWYARQDLLTLEAGLAAPEVPWGPVHFHAQQAAEKYIKALIIQRWEEPPYIHDLVELLKICRRLGYDLPALDEDCEVLSPGAVKARYPDDRLAPPPMPTREQAEAAVAAMRRVIAVAAPLLPEVRIR